MSGTTKSPWSGLGDAGGDGPYVLNDPMWQIVDNISWVKGKHSMRFGFEYNRQTFSLLGNQFSRGQFTFVPNATAYKAIGSSTTYSGGDSFADFLLGDLHDSTVAVAVANANFVRNVESGYIEDTYKPLPNFTVSAGVRYEVTPPWVDTYGNDFTVKIPVPATFGTVSGAIPQTQWPYFVRQGNCSNAYTGLAINWTDTTGKAGTTANPAPVCSNGSLPDALLNTKYTNFAPRLAFSYAPFASFVVRAGYGIFYNQDSANAYFDMARNIAGPRSANRKLKHTYGTPSLTWGNAIPEAAEQLPRFHRLTRMLTPLLIKPHTANSS